MLDQETPLHTPKKLFAIWVVTIAFVSPLSIWAIATLPEAWHSLQNGKAPPSGPWWMFVVAQVFIHSATVSIVGTQILACMTALTNKGIRKYTWRGIVFLPWEKVTKVEFRGLSVEVLTADAGITLYASLFSRPDDVWTEIFKRVPPEALDDYARRMLSRQS